MEGSDTFTFMVVASLLVISPGPNGVLIAQTVPTSGRGAGFANVAGFVAAFYLHGALAILGISLILVHSAIAFAIVKYLGAAYLCWIGIRALRAAVRGADTAPVVTPARRRRTLVRAFGEGLLTNTLNPKVSMLYLAAFPQFITIGETPVASSIFLVFVHSMINAAWFCAMVMLAARLSRATRSARFQRWLKAVTGVIFVGFGLKLAAYRSNA